MPPFCSADRTRLTSEATYSPAGLSCAIVFAHAYAEYCERDEPRTRARLKDATHDIVERMRCDGLSPECVLITLKQAIREHSTDHFTPSLISCDDHDAAYHHTRVYERVFAWFLVDYFSEALSPSEDIAVR